MRTTLVLSLLFAITLGASAQAPTLTVTPESVTLLKDGKVKLKLPDGLTGVTVRDPKETDQAKIDPATFIIEAKATGETEFTLEHAASSQVVAVPVRVIAISGIEIEGIALPLVEGERRQLAVIARDASGTAIADVPFTFTSTNTNVVRVEPGPVLVATATNVDENAQSADVALSVEGKPVELDGQPFKFKVTVVEPIKQIRLKGSGEIRIAEGGQIDLADRVELIGKNSGKPYAPGARRLVLLAGNHLELKNNRLLTAQALPTAIATDDFTQFVTVGTPEAAPGVNVAPEQLTVRIILRPLRLQITPALIALPRDGMTDVLTATLFNRGGSAELFYDVSWDLPNEAENVLGIVRLSNNTARVIWKGEEDPAHRLPRFIEITASASSAKERTAEEQRLADSMPDGSSLDAPFQAKAFVRILPSVANFAPLTVRLNLMDDRTVADLFGEKTAQEFYVARVRLYNNLKRTNDGVDLRGESILAFSDSIEVGVAVETRRVQKRQWWTKDEKETAWRRLTAGEVEWAASTGYTPRRVPEPEPVVDARSGCKGRLTYRPYTFEMIVNSSDPRYERSRRARTFRLLQGIGTVASFVTSVAVPGEQSDIPLGLEKYTNLLIPGLQKLFPDIRDTQRQNIVSMTMKPIEEIPFGSDLSRVIFFPKGSFQGLLRGHETRISEICPNLFTVEVAVLDKSGKQSVTVDASGASQ